MIDTARARAIAEEWVDAWNAHDPERVVSHFTDDVVIFSPLAAQVRPESNGVLHGKEAVLSYYRDGLAQSGALHFTLVEVCTGVNEVAIVYQNHRDVLVTEYLRVHDDGRAFEVHVAYGT
jgi:uncharacterized protein (TIGR02246 family)